MKYLPILLLLFILVLPAYASYDKPGKGVTVKPARATWNTGYFQAALIEQGLKDLGYRLKRTKELQNPLFYQTAALGDLDYWPNGWFPNHIGQMPKNWEEQLEIIGYVAKAGGLQGYLVSKEHADKYNIKSLDDFKRPEVKRAFDANEDGKADLTACPPGWGCEKGITHHFNVYGLDDHINPIKAGYSASMADTLARFRSGEAIFFYTWAPNWTIGKLVPGQDVTWINVPEINPTKAQEPGKDRMTVSGVKGAVSDPLKAGFVVSDIQIVANKAFLEENPAARMFFEVFNLPLDDINSQNTKMQDGEKSTADIQRHVNEWIASNQGKWNNWLKMSRDAAKNK